MRTKSLVTSNSPLKLIIPKEQMEKKYNRTKVFDKAGNLLPVEQRTFITTEGYKCILVDGGTKGGAVTAQIENYIFESYIQPIKAGNITYPFHPSFLGIGYIGVGKYKTKENKKATKVYISWSGILERAYSDNYHKTRPTYKNVTVCEEWHNFQNFAEWFYEKSNYQEGWALDKDLLSENNKVYSPETCIFIPPELNGFLANNTSANTSGATGVHFEKSTGKFMARITDVVSKERLYLGVFNTIKEAENVYNNARKGQAQVWKNRMYGVLPSKAIEKIR